MMATRYPANKSLQARLKCVIEALSHCRAVLSNVRIVTPQLTPGVRNAVESQIRDALAKTEVASDAIAGV